MKRHITGFIYAISLAVFTGSAFAGDFEWLDNMNVAAQADSSGFRVRLATRFHIGDAQVSAVIGNVDRMADAYMVLRYSELCRCPVDHVTRVYQSDHKKGWGAMAKQLGIKPGSSEFHALKNGHDLYDTHDQEHSHGANGGNDKGKKHGNSQGKSKNKH